jgi:hypothetical protein
VTAGARLSNRSISSIAFIFSCTLAVFGIAGSDARNGPGASSLVEVVASPTAGDDLFRSAVGTRILVIGTPLANGT